MKASTLKVLIDIFVENLKLLIFSIYIYLPISMMVKKLWITIIEICEKEAIDSWF